MATGGGTAVEKGKWQAWLVPFCRTQKEHSTGAMRYHKVGDAFLQGDQFWM